MNMQTFVLFWTAYLLIAVFTLAHVIGRIIQ